MAAEVTGKLAAVGKRSQNVRTRSQVTGKPRNETTRIYDHYKSHDLDKSKKLL